MSGYTILLVSLGCAAVLFMVAYIGEKQVSKGRSWLTNNPYVYTLSLAVYCTAWTYYGSVGRAASSGIGFLPIYLGPTFMAILYPVLLRKIIRIVKVNRITSIADFIGSRYGKSYLLSGLTTIIAVFGIVPYLSLQLKAISTTFNLLWETAVSSPFSLFSFPLLNDTAFVVAMLLSLFTILFGARHLDATTHNAGMVLAIAFEAVVKLAAFLVVGWYVSYIMHDGFAEIYASASQNDALAQLFTFEPVGSFSDWAWLIFLSMMAILFLPRQFQMGVIENLDERHLNKAMWGFPLYMLLINIFVLPIALAGLLIFPDGNPDLFVLTLPLSQNQIGLTLFVYIGGLFAATGMFIVATVTLSTMVSNDLIIPLQLRMGWVNPNLQQDMSRKLLFVRRVSIVAISWLGYLYFRVAGGEPLVSIGLISFAAVAQFAPAILGGMYWKGGNRLGALAGLLMGFLIWAYTLPLPSLVQLGGFLPATFLQAGPLGIGWLRPYALFNLTGMSPLSHSLMWSLLVNVGLYVSISLFTQPRILEHTQATRFVDVFHHTEALDEFSTWRRTASVKSLKALVSRFIGKNRTEQAFMEWINGRSQNTDPLLETHYAPPALVNYTEKLLAGAIGSASANAVIASLLSQDTLTLDEVMAMLEETSQVYRYSRRLEEQSQEIERKSEELRIANERLKELDEMKNDFVSHVTHELRTPLTSIRAFSEILQNNPEIGGTQRDEFLGIIRSESERLTRLINNVLDLAKIESGNAEWLISDVDMRQVVQEAVNTQKQHLHDRNIKLQLTIQPNLPLIKADRDRLMQVVLNLLSNAFKFCDEQQGKIWITLTHTSQYICLKVKDNGSGIKAEDMGKVFAKFQQVRDHLRGKPQGTGLGLPISYHIVQHFDGKLWAESDPGEGATFFVELPLPQPTNDLAEPLSWQV